MSDNQAKRHKDNKFTDVITKLSPIPIIAGLIGSPALVVVKAHVSQMHFYDWVLLPTTGIALVLFGAKFAFRDIESHLDSYYRQNEYQLK